MYTCSFRRDYECVHSDVSISRYVLDELDSDQFYHDIIFCFESDSIVVSFLSGTGFLRDLISFGEPNQLRFSFIGLLLYY